MQPLHIKERLEQAHQAQAHASRLVVTMLVKKKFVRAWTTEAIERLDEARQVLTELIAQTTEER